ncbi:FeoA family protein [Kordiimonas sp.]|uniref:FeoA family protein n=1 Tax=Kordiimonas sp. TaxID=1970157 RepID=UPI003A9082F4
MNNETPVAAPGIESLGQMRPGARGRIASFDAAASHCHHNDMVDRLREMGFAEDLEIEVLHQSPFGRDPIAVRVGKMTVALRRKDAHIVKVQLA